MKLATLVAASALSLTTGFAVAAGYSSQAGAYDKPRAEAPSPAQNVAYNLLRDANEMTLYIFDNDAPQKSNCYAGCATDWPPFYAAADATPYGNFTVIARTDGTYQWAWKGQPLYYWSGDQNPGDTGGDGIGGIWHVVYR